MGNYMEFYDMFTLEMLEGLPDDKKNSLRNACRRVCALTSYYGMSSQHVDVYKEGWHMVFEGCRSRWSCWVGDNDGTFVYGNRKPRKGLHYLHCYATNISEREFGKLLEE